MMPHGLFSCLLYLSTLLIWVESAEHDFRYISFQDLQHSLKKFSQDDVVSYSEMLFDVARNQLLVGARDALFRLSLPNLELLELAEWRSSTNKRDQCLNKGQSDESCHNYIKVLLTNGRNIFACGTNAFSPQCSSRKIENISEVIEWVDGLAKCPYNPNANITGFMSERGEYYFGGPTDFSSSNAVISKNLGSATKIRTDQFDSLKLNDPQFVGSFETEDFVYFLFREAAVEYMNCGKAVYSRIARVCKNDSGGLTMLKDTWTTFLKARLNCSISGEYPFYFDEIQSMSYVPEENVVYATFTTPINSIAGSAICAFNLSAIEAAFAGPFKYRENIDSAWGKHQMQHRDHFNCKSSARGDLLETSKYQLMDSAVQATTLNPLHVAKLERFTHITIDVLPTKLHTAVHVAYVATTEGVIKKISVLPRTQESCVVEVWQAVQNRVVPVRNVQFLKATTSLYVTTDEAVLKIPADHCRRHTSKDSCINAMDPYCGWNERDESCSTAPNGDPLDKYWKQSVTSCPVLDAVVDGGWSSWSSWSACFQRTAPDSEEDHCVCQTRQCNNPAPKNGGRQCDGLSIAVANCTVHGGWSDWSSWSACSATCGRALKTRTRTCTNPSPAHGGRVCVGQSLSTASCQAEIPPCPVLSRDGGWGQWGPWENCTINYPGGCKKRTRKCDRPTPENGGRPCIGNDVEYDFTELTEYKKIHPMVINTSNSTGEFTRKLKITCKAPVRASLIKIHVKEEFCTMNHCSPLKDEPPRWTAWGPWSECSAPCGGGFQKKSRHCEGGDCVGNVEQTRECNKHPCQTGWSCWSDWSPCNVSCGWGVRRRHRTCADANCTGSNWEQEPCYSTPCGSSLGWSNWTEWSLCDKNNEQHRKRQCQKINPGSDMCQGSSLETRMCLLEQLEDMNIVPRMAPHFASVGGAIFFVFVGIVIGTFPGAIAMHFYQKKKRNKIPSSPHYMRSNQNPYIFLPLRDKSKKSGAASSSNYSSKYSDCESATLKKNGQILTNGHAKDLLDDNERYYD